MQVNKNIKKNIRRLDLDWSLFKNPDDIIIVDNFYDTPQSVRDFALGLEYVKYTEGWYSSALDFKDNPLKGRGVRHINEDIKDAFEEITGSEIDSKTWDKAGYGWNGAFHYKTLWGGKSQIHNHTGRDKDVMRGWAGLIYLNKKSPFWTGTTIWRNKNTGKCYEYETTFTPSEEDYELIAKIENVYNRLLLFDASTFHRGERGTGFNIRTGRMFQTFFFNIK